MGGKPAIMLKHNNPKFPWKILLLACVAAMMVIESQAQPKMGQPSGADTAFQNRFYVPWNSEDYRWTAVPWTTDDGKYKAIRVQIDQQLTKNANGLTLVNRCDEAAFASPKDPLAQFRWGYAYYQWMTRRNKDLPLTKEWRTGDIILHALADAPDPKNYEYMRLRFLMLSWRRRRQELIPAGERLLKHKPNDSEVKLRLIQVTSITSHDRKVKQQALTDANELVYQNPATSRYQMLLAGVCLTLWMDSHSQEDGEKAIAEYSKFLRMSEPNNYFRSRAKEIIRLISARLATGDRGLSR